jgi:BetI-type transcriptional repressor, C-terminal
VRPAPAASRPGGRRTGPEDERAVDVAILDGRPRRRRVGVQPHVKAARIAPVQPGQHRCHGPPARQGNPGRPGQAHRDVWSEALRNPSLAARFAALVTQLRTSLAELIQQNRANLPGDVPAEVLATTLLSLVPGYLLQLTLMGPDAVADVPDAVLAIWPHQR